MNSSERSSESALLTYTHVIYGLHALSVLIGVISAATIVGSFVFSVPSIVAVMMNYLRRSEAQGSWLDAHFTWQIRTFWYALLWSALILVVSAPLMLVIVGFATASVGLFAVGIWVLYRVIRGWLALREGHPPSATSTPP